MEGISLTIPFRPLTPLDYPGGGYSRGGEATCRCSDAVRRAGHQDNGVRAGTICHATTCIHPPLSLLSFQVADTAEAVRQRADALMLSGESAIGQFPEKALAVLRTVATRIEGYGRAAHSGEQEADIALLPELSDVLSERISEQICAAAAHMGEWLPLLHLPHMRQQERAGEGYTQWGAGGGYCSAARALRRAL
ncbi:unnamed protein product [Closterium sp. NIES-53]